MKIYEQGDSKRSMHIVQCVTEKLEPHYVGQKIHWWNYQGECKRSHTAAQEGDIAGEDVEPPTKK